MDEQESIVRCNHCMKVFYEKEIIYDEENDVEKCPYCGESGGLMDIFNADDADV